MKLHRNRQVQLLPSLCIITLIWLAAGSSVFAMKLLSPQVSRHESPADRSSVNLERYLLLDERIISEKDNVKIELGPVVKESGNPLMTEEYWGPSQKKWEARYDNLYPNVIYDEDDELYKIWYKCFVNDKPSETTPIKNRPEQVYVASNVNRRHGILFACSEDGLNWIKPRLGRVEFQGDSKNNIVMLDFEGGVFKDTYESDPGRLYKMFGRMIEGPTPAERHMAVAFSGDGLTWSDPVPWPDHNVIGDAHNNAFWDSKNHRYVGMTRVRDDGERIVVRTESRDFIHWTKPQEVLRGEGKEEQIYSMPVFPYANVYLGFPAVLRGDPPHDTVDTELAWSPDTEEWHRIEPGTALIPRGGNLADYPESDYDAGCIFASIPVIAGDVIKLYYGGSNNYHVNWREGSLNLAWMRKDGFAGYSPADTARPGIIITVPLTVTGPELLVNADAKNKKGGLRAAVLDRNRQIIPGYELDKSTIIQGTATDSKVTWEGETLQHLLGEVVYLKFVLNDCTLFSFAGNVSRQKNVNK